MPDNHIKCSDEHSDSVPFNSVLLNLAIMGTKCDDIFSQLEEMEKRTSLENCSWNMKTTGIQDCGYSNWGMLFQVDSKLNLSVSDIWLTNNSYNWFQFWCWNWNTSLWIWQPKSFPLTKSNLAKAIFKEIEIKYLLNKVESIQGI